MTEKIKFKNCIIAVLSSAFLAFGLYHVHSLSGVTEGGVLGLNLFLQHWFGISPSITNFVVTAVCFLLGLKLLGREFIIYSVFAVISFSVSYRIFESFPHLWPFLYDMPLLASFLGAIFVGVGTGLCVRVNAAICGDDALAMCISHITGMKVQWAYLISDVAILLLSATYIPWNRLIYSFITVIISGQIIGFIQKMGNKKGEDWPLLNFYFSVLSNITRAAITRSSSPIFSSAWLWPFPVYITSPTPTSESMPSSLNIPLPLRT